MKNLSQNKMKPLITFLFLFINFTSCSSQEDYGKISDDIMFQTAKQLKKEKCLHFAGYGGARMYDVEKLNLSLDYYESLNIEQARKLIVYCANKFLDNINNSEKVRPYLRNYPFTSKNITLAIFIEDEKNSIGSTNITTVAISRGKIDYYIDTFKPDLMKVTHTETFEEALEIVNNEKSFPE